MKHAILVLLSGISLCGQTFTGTWQGTLKVPQAPNGELRVVIKIATADKGVLQADFYNIDQPAPPLKADSVIQSGSTLRMNVTSLGGTYEGKLGADGNSITGAWTTGTSTPLNLVKATPETAWTIPEPAPPPKMMPADANPGIEVATIKPSRPEEHFSLTTNPGLVTVTAGSVADLIKFAYGGIPARLSGRPRGLSPKDLT